MTDIRFTLSRTLSFFRTVFKSKMAVAGLIILVVFSFLAIAAPAVTPYNPYRDIVAGQYAPPSWYGYFPGGNGLSQNMALESTTGFQSNPNLDTSWKFISDSGNHITEAYDPNTSTPPNLGSVRLTLDRSTGPLTGTYTATF